MGSYLHAKDPSLVDNDSAQEKETLPIYLRIKNGYNFNNLYEISDNNLICKIPPGSKFNRNIRGIPPITKTYTFSSIYSECSQTNIFNSIVKPKLIDFINGENGSFLTYGASGSGKTFTVNGTAEDPGMIPRTLDYLFRTMPKLNADPIVKPLTNDQVVFLSQPCVKQELAKTRTILNSTDSEFSLPLITYSEMQSHLSSENVGMADESEEVSICIYVSFAEIYNEHIYDLLRPPPSNGQKRPNLAIGRYKSKNFIKNLTMVHVRSGAEAYQVFRHGLDHLVFGETGMNMHSSRSHSIFTIKLLQVTRAHRFCLVKFNFCDLAGCERLKRTHNEGERLKESNNINNSLLVLSRCIHEVRTAQKKGDFNYRIPFRESKVTQLFQKGLSGEEYLSLIVTINPRGDYFDETQHVLNFAAVVKEVEHRIEPIRKRRFATTIVDSMMHDDVPESGEEPENIYDLINLLREALEEQKLITEQKTEKIMKAYNDAIAIIQENDESEIDKLESNYWNEDGASDEENDDLLRIDRMNFKAGLNRM